MNHFYVITTQNGKNNSIEIYPDFQVIDEDTDLMVRGKSFYAVWDDEAGMWSTNAYVVRRIVDREMAKKKAELEKLNVGSTIKLRKMQSYSSKSWEQFCTYVTKMPDQFKQLDDILTFSDTVVKKDDYRSKRLPYALKEGSHESWDEIIGTLYSEENRAKLEWAIGSIIAGDSRTIQKFVVLYGKGGTGKSTILNIIQELFKGYYAVFEAKGLTTASEAFSMEPFKTNPLVAIQHDGDLSRIEDNTRLNSIVSHETMLMNEKNKPKYPFTPHCFLFLGTNEPVKIKDAESGIIRRLIDVEPTGNRIPPDRYNLLMERVKFELGGIAEHCLKVYKKMGKHYYDTYRPKSMMYRTDVFFNFIEDSYDVFLGQDGVSLKNAYAMWTNYCTEAGVDNKMPRHKFREELKNYFEEFKDVDRIDGKQVRSYYHGFIKDCFNKENYISKPEPQDENLYAIKLDKTNSILDEILKDCKAQYADTSQKNEPPLLPWDQVTTTLKDLDTTKVHYILPPSWLVMVDLDLKNEKGEKDKRLNLEAASKLPETYMEFSKGGSGVHLYYRYTGDLDRLRGLLGPEKEIKIFRGKAALRRRVSFCNGHEIATLSSGLPEKEKKMVSSKVIEDERHLINLINKALRKEISNCESTRQSCNYIKDILDQAYESKMHYDVSSLRKKVRSFAMKSTNNKRYCTDLVRKMKFASEDVSEAIEGSHAGTMVFFDCEVFPNMNCVNWKVAGPDHEVVKMINPTPDDIESLLQYDLFGFNCRRYDNHILHAIRLGFTPKKVYDISTRIIDKDESAFFAEAWSYSKSDILDFSSKKQSLKKFEIELGFHHKELGFDWRKPVPEDKWTEVAEYCVNDVLATEALFFSPDRQADWTARQILADLADMTVNDTTNSLSTRIIFGRDKNPQTQFNYRDMGDVNQIDPEFKIPMIDSIPLDPEFTKFDHQGRPIFPGYKNEHGVSTYRGEEIGEGGYVCAEKGAFTSVPVMDIESMHPSSIEDEVLFGPTYTKNFSDIKQARIYIKHGDYDKAKELFGGKLAKYLDHPERAEALSMALKIVINSVYGLTSARFDNPFRDKRNKDNIVAKRGALFMVNLKHEVRKRGFTVAHIKTDSIKIPNATVEILNFVREYGKLYGYKFDHESTYEKMCLVNDAVYIAKYDTVEHTQELYGYIPSKQKKNSGKWTATGTQFQVPYVFKTLFTHEAITLEDMFETKSVTTALYLDMNENLSQDEHNYIFIGKCGAFCPVKPGTNGGELCREKDGKYYAATGSKGYRWKEYEIVKSLGLEEEINREYYDVLCQKAKEEIEKYCDFNLFIAD